MADYKSKAARCRYCGILIKMEPCDQCESGYWPDKCPTCDGPIIEVENGTTPFTLIEPGEE